MPTLKKTKFNGVYYRDSDKRKFQGKPDRCFYIKYYYNGKQYNKRIGWLSEGYTAQLVANIKADKIIEITEKEEQIKNIPLTTCLKYLCFGQNKIKKAGK